MKKSNKILLGGLLTVLLILISIHVALYAKLKSGDHKIYDEKEKYGNATTSVFNNIHSVLIRDKANTVLRFGDSLKVMQFSESDDLNIRQENGQLIVAGKDSSKNGKRSGSMVIIQIPAGTEVFVKNAMLRVEASKEPAFTSLQMNLDNADAFFGRYAQAVVIDSLKITATNSSYIDLENVRTQYMEAQLTKSTINELVSVINQIVLNADDSSRIQMQARHLSRLKVKNTATHE